MLGESKHNLKTAIENELHASKNYLFDMNHGHRQHHNTSSRSKHKSSRRNSKQTNQSDKSHKDFDIIDSEIRISQKTFIDNFEILPLSISNLAHLANTTTNINHNQSNNNTQNATNR